MQICGADYLYAMWYLSSFVLLILLMFEPKNLLLTKYIFYIANYIVPIFFSGNISLITIHWKNILEANHTKEGN